MLVGYENLFWYLHKQVTFGDYEAHGLQKLDGHGKRLLVSTGFAFCCSESVVCCSESGVGQIPRLSSSFQKVLGGRGEH